MANKPGESTGDWQQHPDALVSGGSSEQEQRDAADRTAKQINREVEEDLGEGKGKRKNQ